MSVRARPGPSCAAACGRNGASPTLKARPPGTPRCTGRARPRKTARRLAT